MTGGGDFFHSRQMKWNKCCNFTEIHTYSNINYTLFELNTLMRLTIEKSLSEEYYVEAELSEALIIHSSIVSRDLPLDNPSCNA